MVSGIAKLDEIKREYGNLFFDYIHKDDCGARLPGAVKSACSPGELRRHLPPRRLPSGTRPPGKSLRGRPPNAMRFRVPKASARRLDDGCSGSHRARQITEAAMRVFVLKPEPRHRMF